MKRYWFEFDFTDIKEIPAGVIIGCGVTGDGYDDALNILKEKVFQKEQIPEIKKVVEDVDVSLLDKGHVLPNMLPPNMRGVWFPLGYQ
jgi:hypothetical protein